MQHNYHNISQTGRRIAGMTQERWAEALDISVESVRLYESGRGMPSDDVATRMVEVSGAPVLGYWHLLNKSRVAADLLPQVDTIALPPEKRLDKFTLLPVAPVFSEAIERIYEDKPVSIMFV